MGIVNCEQCLDPLLQSVSLIMTGGRECNLGISSCSSSPGSRHYSQLPFRISCYYQTHRLEKRIQTPFTTNIPYLLLLSNSQTGEEDPDDIQNLHSLSLFIIKLRDWRRRTRHCLRLTFPITYHYWLSRLEKRVKIFCKTYIPCLISLSNSQTGEEDPDTIHN